MANHKIELYVSVITLNGTELRNIADMATGGETLVAEITHRSLPRWLLRLLFGANAMYHIDQMSKIATGRDYSVGLVKLLRDYEPLDVSDD
jgi:hypothetical protein